MTIPKTIGKRIKLLRKELGLTQQEFGKKIYRDKSIISKIEGDEVELSSSNRLAICKVFGIREDWIVKGDGEMKDLRDSDSLLEETMEMISRRHPTKQDLGKSVVSKTARRGEKFVHGWASGSFLVSDIIKKCTKILESETALATTLYLTVHHLDMLLATMNKSANICKDNADADKNK